MLGDVEPGDVELPPVVSGARNRARVSVRLPSVQRQVRWKPGFPPVTTRRISCSFTARLSAMALSRRAPRSESSGSHGSVS